MNKNDILDLEIVDIGNNGEGIAKYQNTIVFIPFALIGEIIKTHILKVNKGIAFGKILSIEKESPLRDKPLCPLFTKCGGCNMQHIIYQEQLKIKKQTVCNALHKYSNLNPIVNDCIYGSNNYEYRNKMQFPCSPKGIGMYAEKSHTIINIENCPLSMPLSKKAYQLFRDFCKNTNQEMYDEQTSRGLIRHFVVREIKDKISICVVINGKKIPRIENYIQKLDNVFGKNYGLFYNINTQKSNTIMSNQTLHICGDEYLNLNDFGIDYKICPNSFLQVNSDIQNLLYSKVLELIPQGTCVINAYSGAGLLTAILAKRSKFVYGIEIIKQATNDADKLMMENDIKNTSNITGDCAIELPKLMQSLRDQNTTLVLDPPRKGCEQNILDTITQCKPKNIVYISCNPATLSRDINTLKDFYDIQLVQPYDMFPQTKHVEVLVHFTLKENIDA